MARHGSAHPGSRQRRLVGVVAVAALLAGSVGAVMAFGVEGPTAERVAAGPAAPTTTAAPSIAIPSATPSTTTTKAVKPKPKRTPARTTTAPARAASRTAAPKLVQVAPRPSSRTTAPRATAAPRPAPKPAPRPVAVSSGVSSQVLALVNDERARAGCGSLSTSSALQRAAQGHSADMAANDYFSHDSQDGRTFADRIRAAGYTGGAIAENIAAGQSTASSVVKSWMNSSGHRANILNCSYRYLGVGYAKGGSYGSYWTQDFGG